MVMGIGFPPHHGGPVAYARARGLDAIVARMKELAQAFGSQLEPSDAIASAVDKDGKSAAQQPVSASGG